MIAALGRMAARAIRPTLPWPAPSFETKATVRDYCTQRSRTVLYETAAVTI